MTDHEKNLILAVVKHHMRPDLRRIVMTTVPSAYNAWVGHDVVQVARTSDGTALTVNA